MAAKTFAISAFYSLQIGYFCPDIDGAMSQQTIAAANIFQRRKFQRDYPRSSETMQPYWLPSGRRDGMQKISALLALCDGNPPVLG